MYGVFGMLNNNLLCSRKRNVCVFEGEFEKNIMDDECYNRKLKSNTFLITESYSFTVESLQYCESQLLIDLLRELS